MRRLTPSFTTLILAAASAAAHAQPNLLPNGTFDADVDHWTIPNDPAVTVSWSGFGNPGGSLRLDVTEPNTSAGVHSACISSPSGFYTVRGQSLRPSGEPAVMICRATIRGWSEPNCEGSVTTIQGPPAGPPDEWVELEYVGVLGDFGIDSIVVDLHAERLGGAGTTTCYFDNIHLTGPIPSPLEIPSLGGAGLAAFSALLLLAATVALRR